MGDLKQKEEQIRDSLATFEVIQDLLKHHKGDKAKICGLIKREDVDQVIILLRDHLKITQLTRRNSVES